MVHRYAVVNVMKNELIYKQRLTPISLLFYLVNASLLQRFGTSVEVLESICCKSE